MKNEYIELTEENFQKIYSDEKFRNEVAFAHGCYSASPNSKFKHFGTCSYPIRYIVSEEQKKLANEELERSKKEAIESVKDCLVFVAMGMDYVSRYEDDVCNHRIRTEILNPDGKKFFIEVGTWGEELTRFDFVIDRDLEAEYDRKSSYWRDKINEAGGFNKVGFQHEFVVNLEKYKLQPYYHFKRDSYKDLKLKYTKENIIKIVNELFDCNFKTMRLDYYNLSTEDFICKSPLV
jgi:hypothetical protein